MMVGAGGGGDKVVVVQMLGGGGIGDYGGDVEAAMMVEATVMEVAMMVTYV